MSTPQHASKMRTILLGTGGLLALLVPTVTLFLSSAASKGQQPGMSVKTTPHGDLSQNVVGGVSSVAAFSLEKYKVPIAISGTIVVVTVFAIVLTLLLTGEKLVNVDETASAGKDSEANVQTVKVDEGENGVSWNVIGIAILAAVLLVSVVGFAIVKMGLAKRSPDQPQPQQHGPQPQPQPDVHDRPEPQQHGPKPQPQPQPDVHGRPQPKTDVPEKFTNRFVGNNPDFYPSCYRILTAWGIFSEKAKQLHFSHQIEFADEMGVGRKRVNLFFDGTDKAKFIEFRPEWTLVDYNVALCKSGYTCVLGAQRNGKRLSVGSKVIETDTLRAAKVTVEDFGKISGDIEGIKDLLCDAEELSRYNFPN